MTTKQPEPFAMRGCRRFLISVILGWGLSSPSTVARELWDYEWHEVRTPNFVIVSAIDRQDTVALAQRLENFRRLVAIMTNITEFEPRVPTHIYVLPKPAPELGLAAKLGGYFRPGLRANYAVLRRLPDSVLGDVLQHEYVHFLVRNRGREMHPTWFDEGFAEFLSTLRMEREQFSYGDISDGRLAWLAYEDWINFERLLRTRSTHDLNSRVSAMFYAQSWVLVHYLVFGREGRNFSTDYARFQALVQAKQDPISAFETAFGDPVTRLERTLRNYLGRKVRYYKGTLKEPFPATATQVAPAAIADVIAGLGMLSFTGDDLDLSARIFDTAIAREPTHGRALAGRADVHKFKKEFSAAEPLYEKAIAAAPDDAGPMLDYGQYLLERAENASGDERRAYLLKARANFTNSLNRDRKIPETYVFYARSFLLPEEDPSRALPFLEIANRLLPGHPDVLLTYAQTLVLVNRPEDARPLAQRVLSWSDGGAYEAASRLLETIDAHPDAATAQSQPDDEALN